MGADFFGRVLFEVFVDSFQSGNEFVHAFVISGAFVVFEPFEVGFDFNHGIESADKFDAAFMIFFNDFRGAFQNVGTSLEVGFFHGCAFAETADVTAGFGFVAIENGADFEVFDGIHGVFFRGAV